jgi:dephospho-CoA kinase
VPDHTEKSTQRPPLIVGVTGGIGCGKSTAAALFVGRGAGLIDTDAIAHQLTAPGGAALAQIAQAFGTEYFTDEGALDRARLRQLVFSDGQAKRNLEQILHPLIRQEVDRQLAANRAPYVLVAIPLLIETGAYRKLVQRVLVVDCSEATQIARTTQRSGIDEAQVRAIMRTQVSREQRLAAADDVIDNDASLENLERQVEALDAAYRALARVA